MSSITHYYSDFNRRCIDYGREYVETRSLERLSHSFNFNLNMDDGRVVIKALRENSLLFDNEYMSIPIQISPSFVPQCKLCFTKSYDPWKLVGVPEDTKCAVLKCILPCIWCEQCFRKRFCYQDELPILCGVAVFPPLDYSIEKYKNIGSQPHNAVNAPTNNLIMLNERQPPSLARSTPPTHSSNHLPSSLSKSSSQNRRGLSSSNEQPKSTHIPTTNRTPSLYSQRIPNGSQSSRSGPSSRINIHSMNVSQPKPSQPMKSTPVPSIHQSFSPQPDGTFLLKRSSAQPSEIQPPLQPPSTTENTEDVPEQKEEPPTESNETEVAYAEETPELPEWCIYLEYQHGGFWRYWNRNYFVINTTSVIKYPNEHRNENKRKEIFLYDAVIQHSIVASDSKRPFCVEIKPGKSSSITKPFVVSFTTEEDMNAFIKEMGVYTEVARKNPPTYSAQDGDDSD